MKLLWNTNRNLPDIATNIKEERIIFWGNYHFKNSSPWILNLLSRIQIEQIDSLKNLNKNEDIIVVDNLIGLKESFYFELSNKVKRIYLVHLGDEGGSEKKDLVYLYQKSHRAVIVMRGGAGAGPSGGSSSRAGTPGVCRSRRRSAAATFANSSLTSSALIRASAM